MPIPALFTRNILMKKSFYPFLVSFIAFLLVSCRISGNLKGLYGYYNKTKSESPDLIVHPNSGNICKANWSESNRVFATNGKELGNCIKEENHAVVFIWTPNCHGQFCYSLDAVQQACNQKKIELYIVAEYYDSEKMKMNYTLKRPIYGIDTKYYKTNLTAKYLSRFLMDMIGKQEIDANFLRFKNGLLEASFQRIEEL